ncbi:MAG: replication/maintenance protein RepL [Sulfuricurvum sp.]|nr:replication/maintenance protein RepL [Sulfuricurvum sp.]MDD3770342.1 replication/maintenance protein RepL [Sulfuricurvum sp.]
MASKLQYETTETIITRNLETQKATHVSEKSTRTLKVPQEDAYVKVYLKDISRLHDLSPQSNKFLYEFFSMANWNTNELQITAGKKNELAQKYNTSKAVIDNVISKLTKKNIIIKKGTGLYILNPHLFGKGTWGEIRALRLTIDYDLSTGEKSIQAEPTAPKTKIEKEWELMEGIEQEINELEELGVLSAQ